MTAPPPPSRTRSHGARRASGSTLGATGRHRRGDQARPRGRRGVSPGLTGPSRPLGVYGQAVRGTSLVARSAKGVNPGNHWQIRKIGEVVDLAPALRKPSRRRASRTAAAGAGRQARSAESRGLLALRTPRTPRTALYPLILMKREWERGRRGVGRGANSKTRGEC